MYVGKHLLRHFCKGLRGGLTEFFHVRPFPLALESRQVPAIFLGTNALDAGAGSLRQAVHDANATSGADSITFSALFSNPQIITLTTGQLAISDPLMITGPGAGVITISGNKQSRIFDISSAPTATMIYLTGLTLIAGKVSDAGGAILANNQQLTLADCVLTGNSAMGSGGAVAVTSGGSLTATRSTFASNDSRGQGGAINVSGTTSKTELELCRISGNSSTAGGGIYASGLLQINGCIISNNLAVSYPTGAGGGIKFWSGSALASATILNSSVTNNNSDTEGGGIAIFQFGLGAPLLVENSTISHNTTLAFGGGIRFYDFGPGTPLVVQNSTISQNTATAASGEGGGIYATHSATADIRLQSSVVASNHNAIAPDIGATTVVASNSAVFSQLGITSFVDLGGNRPFGEDPMLGPLQNNGGPTLTHAVLPGSPLIDNGANPAGLTSDQRGYLRTVGAGPDIGAYELQPPRVSSVVVNDGSVQRSRVASLIVTFDSPVPLPTNPADAFRLARQSDNESVLMNATVVGNSVTLTVAGGVPFSFGSLGDGRYTLTAFAGQINGGNFDGNGDGTAGDDYVQVGSPTSGSKLFRLFGDADGNGTVNDSDFRAFRSAFGGTSLIFDYDGVGGVTTLDFNHFRLRFGSSV